MKQLMIGVVLIVSYLVGYFVAYIENPKFSINRTDSLYFYKYNPILFTKVASNMTDNMYCFTSTPDSVYGIKTSDLDVLEGYVVFFPWPSNTSTNLNIKGKEAANILIDRLRNVIPSLNCAERVIENRDRLDCDDATKRTIFSIYYDDPSEGILDVHFSGDIDNHKDKL